MKKLIFGITFACCVFNVHAATAFFTGQMKYITTVTGLSGIACVYEYSGQRFTVVIPRTGSCPTSIQVQ